VPDVELETPDLDVDEEAPAYKRVVAVLVVLITLFGSIVAYLQAVESNDEDVAARDAQRDAVAGLGSQVDASAAFAADLRIGSELDVQLERQALNAARVNNFAGDPEADVHIAAAERFAAVREAIAGLTPVDPSDPATVADTFADLNESPDAARLRQQVQADLANDHGGKADSYVAVLTVLAVSLFLLGLSLTVQGRSRIVLAAPGLAIGIVCVAWTAFIVREEVTEVSEQAIRAAAEGERLKSAGDFDGAIEAYEEAIDDSPDFAAAFARRASAHFARGSAQIGQGTDGFISITSEDALQDTIADVERALELGADSDVITVGDAGFFFFLDGDFDRAAALSEQALELNDQLAPIWFNLGLAELARGDERASARAYREGRQILDDAPDQGARAALLAAARTDLSILRELLDGDELEDRAELIEATEAELAAFEASFVEIPCDDEPCPAAEDVDGGAEIGDVTFSTNGAFVFGQYEVRGAEPGTPITNLWYVRADDDLPFEQTALGLDVVRVGDDGSLFTVTLPSVNPACPVPGEYLVRAYAGDQLLGEATGTIEPGQFGSSFTALADPVEGFEACVPEGFDVQRADVTGLDAFTGLAGPEFLLGFNVTPGQTVEGEAAQRELSRQLVSQVLQIDESELVEVAFQGRDLEGNAVQLPAFAGAGSFDGLATVTATAVGPDGATRNITITGSDDLTLLQEAIGLIQFTNIGPPVE
jgi:tetratricopeptide (TPR) repeat protein